MFKPAFALIACAALSAAPAAPEGPRLSASTYRALSKAQRLVDAEKNSQALAELEALMPRVKGNAYKSAVVQQTLGYVYNDLGQQRRAAAAFKQALQHNALPAGVVHQLQYNLSSF